MSMKLDDTCHFQLIHFTRQIKAFRNKITFDTNVTWLEHFFIGEKCTAQGLEGAREKNFYTWRYCAVTRTEGWILQSTWAFLNVGIVVRPSFFLFFIIILFSASPTQGEKVKFFFFAALRSVGAGNVKKEPKNACNL